MVIAVLADEILKKEFLSKNIANDIKLIWADSMRSLGIIDADVYFDLLFEYDQERIAKLKQLLPRPVIVNSVIHTTIEIRQPFIRINAWPTMLERSITELATAVPEQAEDIRKTFGAMGWPYQIVADTTGMVTPRMVSVMVNEAYFTIGDGTTKPVVDALLQSVSGYRAGPFEWAEKIGTDRIGDLLRRLSKTDPRYTMAPALTNAKQWH